MTGEIPHAGETASGLRRVVSRRGFLGLTAVTLLGLGCRALGIEQPPPTPTLTPTPTKKDPTPLPKQPELEIRELGKRIGVGVSNLPESRFPWLNNYLESQLGVKEKESGGFRTSVLDASSSPEISVVKVTKSPKEGPVEWEVVGKIYTAEGRETNLSIPLPYAQPPELISIRLPALSSNGTTAVFKEFSPLDEKRFPTVTWVQGSSNKGGVLVLSVSPALVPAPFLRKVEIDLVTQKPEGGRQWERRKFSVLPAESDSIKASFWGQRLEDKMAWSLIYGLAGNPENWKTPPLEFINPSSPRPWEKSRISSTKTDFLVFLNQNIRVLKTIASENGVDFVGPRTNIAEKPNEPVIIIPWESVSPYEKGLKEKTLSLVALIRPAGQDPNLLAKIWEFFSEDKLGGGQIRTPGAWFTISNTYYEVRGSTDLRRYLAIAEDFGSFPESVLKEIQGGKKLQAMVAIFDSQEPHTLGGILYSENVTLG